eukprot:SAG25_NODE_6545_length_551_cov_60.438053_2_plen_30_part_01
MIMRVIFDLTIVVDEVVHHLAAPRRCGWRR